MSDHHAGPLVDRDELRARLRRMRDAMPPVERARAAQRLAAALPTCERWQRAATIGVYRAVRGELDPSIAAADARGRAATTLVPVLHGERLRFAPFDESSSWRPNRYGIDEPAGVPTVDVEELDVLILPAVAVDRAGNRIGMGAGWYDRTLATVARSSAGGPWLIAAVHPFQVVAELRARDWDVPVDAVATPDGVQPVS